MDLMNLNNDKFAGTQRESFIDPDLFVADPAKGQNGTYKAIGRFLPWWKNLDLSKYKKDKAVLVHPLSKDFLRVDCPSSINKPSVLFALDKILKDREKAKQDESLVKEIRESFSRFGVHYSPFYVHKDPQIPMNDNKLKIVEFGYQIDKLIQALLNPAEAELEVDMPGIPKARKINPYSLLDGKDFLWLVKKKSKRFKDYEGCKFMDTVTPFMFLHEGAKHVVTQDELIQTSQGIDTPIALFLKNNTPNMEKYYYKEWTEETYKQVASYLKAIIPYKQLMAELIESCRDLKMRDMLTAQIDMTYNVSAPAPVITPLPTSQAAPTVQPATIAAPAVTPEPAAQPGFVFDQPQHQQPATTPAPVITQAPAEAPVIQAGPPAQTHAATEQAPPPSVVEEDEFSKMLKGL